jgi:lipoate-protein ligase A
MQEKKVAGAAQRKTKHGFLHQGTISLMMPSEDYLRDTLISFGHVMEAMFASSFALMGPDAKMSDLAAARYSMKQLLIKYITREG